MFVVNFIFWENMFDMTSRIIYLLLPLLSQRLHAFCSIESGLKFYFRVSLWHMKRVWWDGIGLHKGLLGWHGGVWEWKFLYWFSAWSNIGIINVKECYQLVLGQFPSFWIRYAKTFLSRLLLAFQFFVVNIS